MDEEKDNQLPFLDVLVERCSFAFITSIYRKPTFTGWYLSWDVFALKSWKINLIKCLTFRALKICSDNGIKSEFEQIKNWVMGILRKLLLTPMNRTVDKFRNNIVPFGSPKCPVYVRFPWIGSLSQLIANKVSSSVTPCYNAALVWTIFTTRAAFCSIHKDVVIFTYSVSQAWGGIIGGDFLAHVPLF